MRGQGKRGGVTDTGRQRQGAGQRDRQTSSRDRHTDRELGKKGERGGMSWIHSVSPTELLLEAERGSVEEETMVEKRRWQLGCPGSFMGSLGLSPRHHPPPHYFYIPFEYLSRARHPMCASIYPPTSLPQSRYEDLHFIERKRGDSDLRLSNTTFPLDLFTAPEKFPNTEGLPQQEETKLGLRGSVQVGMCV